MRSSNQQQSRRRPPPRRGLRVVRPVTGGRRAAPARREAEVEGPRASDQALVSGPQATEPAGDDPPRFGRFAVLGRVGAGAMSTVFAAHDPSLGRKVAIKRVLDDGDGEARTRAQIEAHALARVSHPNVVQIFESGSCGGQAFVAMELIEGVTLSEWQAAAPRTTAETLRMYVQAGRGLAAAHAVGVVHRDFKADNVVIGGDGRARVVDFGLALIVGGPQQVGSSSFDPDASVRLTSSGVVLGTPAYMSPEQHRGLAIDARSDQFNFCAVLYEALYKVRPFAGSTLAEVAVQVRGGVMQRPLRGTVDSEHVYAALLRGLSAGPDRRWSSLTELLDHLERWDRPRPPPRVVWPRRLAAALGLMLLGVGAGAELAGPALVGVLGAALMLVGFAWLLGVRVRAPRLRWSGTA
ncbi:MAG: serine/threonine protein kinase [Myxococcales bacterium]|nr:serine/threonine protein kinase [Myxococcales bacterium]